MTTQLAVYYYYGTRPTGCGALSPLLRGITPLKAAGGGGIKAAAEQQHQSNPRACGTCQQPRAAIRRRHHLPRCTVPCFAGYQSYIHSKHVCGRSASTQRTHRRGAHHLPTGSSPRQRPLPLRQAACVWLLLVARRLPYPPPRRPTCSQSSANLPVSGGPTCSLSQNVHRLTALIIHSSSSTSSIL